jgi:predicted N-acyltransferase
MKFYFTDSIHTVAAPVWDRLFAADGNTYPFVRHHFLAALEDSGCTDAASGWQPHHLLLEQNGELVGAMPLYIKSHSYGEYVFDWGWADACQRAGLAYYPKLLSAIPFTPATGPRLGAPGLEPAALLPLLTAAIRAEAGRLGASSWHCLFPPESLSRALEQQDCVTRVGCQFHWFNPGFADFEAFTATFNARKRKALKRERRQVEEQGIHLSRYVGSAIPPGCWDAFFNFYRDTYRRHSGNNGYLNRDFFRRIAATSAQVLMVVARRGEQIIAAALYFFDADTLYGRYWGCAEDVAGLHFEACYYQGIEFAIERGLRRFDPGAQGEHKIQRGFIPVLTCSSHWLQHPGLAAAVADFVGREGAGIASYRDDCRQYLPFRDDIDSARWLI